MTNIHTLAVLLGRNESQRDTAIAEHLRAVAHRQAASAQSEQLRTYRREYEQRWNAQFAVEGRIELVHCSEITTVAQAEAFAIDDIILRTHKLFSTGVVVWDECARLFSIVIPNWAVREARDPVGLVVGDPALRLRWHLNLWSVVAHAHFIQGDDVADALWKTIRRHKALVKTL